MRDQVHGDVLGSSWKVIWDERDTIVVLLEVTELCVCVCVDRTLIPLPPSAVPGDMGLDL